MREDELRARGLAPADAARHARLDLGGVAPVTEAIRAGRAGAALDRTWQDVRYALRGLRRSPGFAITGIGTLALGIGANLAVFAVVDAEIFKPLPYAEADRLVELEGRGPAPGLTWAELDRWRAEDRLFDRAATFRDTRSARVGAGPDAEVAQVGRVSPELLRLLGVQPRIGRWFATDDLAGGARAILLAERHWRTRLGAALGVVGTTVVIDGRPHTVVGVMPETFAWRIGARVWPVHVVGWLPLDEAEDRARPDATGAAALFRLRPGLALDDARREVVAAAARHQAALGAAEPGADSLKPLDDRLAGSSRNVTLLVLLAAVGAVMLVACTNVANLVVARSIARRRELGVRAAIGASRGRLVRQATTESLVLAVIAGASALAVAGLSRGAIVAFVPERLGLFRANPASIDGRVVAACAALVVLASLVSALPAILRARRPDLIGVLTGTDRASSPRGSGRFVQGFLQSIQVALTTVLLAGCLLLASSLARLVLTDIGFDADGLAHLSIELPPGRYPSAAEREEFRARLLGELRRRPDVQAASYGTPPPWGPIGFFMRPGEAASSTIDTPAAGRPPMLRILAADPEALAVTGIRLVAGRPFDAGDTASTPPVALIDAVSAARLYPDRSPIGQQFRYYRTGPWISIVGVVGEVKSAAFGLQSHRIEVYRPYAQNDIGDDRFRSLLVRDRDGDAGRALAAAKATVRSLDPTIDVSSGGGVADMYAITFDAPRFFATLMTMFAALALTTAAVGLFGLLSFGVARRRHEIGVRLALGASRGRVRAMVVRDAIAPVLAGAAAGLVASVWLSRFLESMLYEITPTDPVSHGAAVGVLGLTTVVAAWVPARRATRVDPAVTLRE